MTSFYSQLTINKQPVSYQVLFHEGRFLFEAKTPLDSDASFFSVAELDGDWLFKGLKDESIKNQVVAEINGFLSYQEMRYASN